MLSSSYGWASIFGQGLATGISAYGARQVAKYNNATLQAQANIARLNAQTMELQAQGALRAAERETLKTSMRAGQVKSAQRAALAANGIAVGEGSAAELQASTDIVKQMDMQQIMTNAWGQAGAARMQATSHEGQALMTLAQKQNPNAVFMQTLASGASQLAPMLADMNRTGAMQFGSSGGGVASTDHYKIIGSSANGWSYYAGARKYPMR